ncbi:MAG: hypothetical protein ACP5UD_08875 [Conexivisphaera sp.]
MNVSKGRSRGLRGRSRSVATRLGEADYDRLVELARGAGVLSVSEYLRSIILEKLNRAEGAEGQLGGGDPRPIVREEDDRDGKRGGAT